MTKVISLSEKAYFELRSAKRGDESFSDVVTRLIHEKKQRPLSDFFGRWAGNDSRRIEQILMKDRKAFKTRDFEL